MIDPQTKIEELKRELKESRGLNKMIADALCDALDHMDTFEDQRDKARAKIHDCTFPDAYKERCEQLIEMTQERDKLASLLNAENHGEICQFKTQVVELEARLKHLQTRCIGRLTLRQEEIFTLKVALHGIDLDLNDIFEDPDTATMTAKKIRKKITKAIGILDTPMKDPERNL